MISMWAGHWRTGRWQLAASLQQSHFHVFSPVAAWPVAYHIARNLADQKLGEFGKNHQNFNRQNHLELSVGVRLRLWSIACGLSKDVHSQVFQENQ